MHTHLHLGATYCRQSTNQGFWETMGEPREPRGSSCRNLVYMRNSTKRGTQAQDWTRDAGVLRQQHYPLYHSTISISMFWTKDYNSFVCISNFHTSPYVNPRQCFFFPDGPDFCSPNCKPMIEYVFFTWPTQQKQSYIQTKVQIKRTQVGFIIHQVSSKALRVIFIMDVSSWEWTEITLDYSLTSLALQHWNVTTAVTS